VGIRFERFTFSRARQVRR